MTSIFNVSPGAQLGAVPAPNVTASATPANASRSTDGLRATSCPTFFTSRSNSRLLTAGGITCHCTCAASSRSSIRRCVRVVRHSACSATTSANADITTGAHSIHPMSECSHERSRHGYAPPQAAHVAASAQFVTGSAGTWGHVKAVTA